MCACISYGYPSYYSYAKRSTWGNLVCWRGIYTKGSTQTLYLMNDQNTALDKTINHPESGKWENAA
jgi:hypothetical protein